MDKALLIENTKNLYWPEIRALTTFVYFLQYFGLLNS